MRTFLWSSLLLLILVTGCEDVRTVTLRNIAHQSDTARVVIYNPESRDVEEGISFYYTSRSTIEQIATFPSEQETEYFKCGYTGIIHLKSKGDVLMEMEFNLDEDCQHITFETVDQNFSQTIRKDGVDFLNERKHEAEAVMAGREELKKLNWLVGNWTYVTKKEIYRENWTYNGAAYLGSGTAFENGEEVFSEKMLIELRGADVYLVVSGAGNEEDVPFLLTELGSQSATFQNPAHDFPSEIYYEIDENGGLRAWIKGETPDGPQQVDFFYTADPETES